MRTIVHRLILLWLLGLGGVASAATLNWTNTSGGSWNVAANWNPNQVPLAGDTAVINVAGTYVVTLSGPATIANLTLGGAAGAKPTLRVEGSAGSGNAMLTCANGFTSHGTIELVDNSIPRSSALTVNSGTLVNAADGVLHSLPGAGGQRAVNARLDNQGTLLVEQDLTVSKTGATHSNSGTITLGGADLTLPQGLDNSGTIQLGGHSFICTGGTVTFTTIPAGPGNIILKNLTLVLKADLDDASAALDFDVVTVNGPGRLRNVAGKTLPLHGAIVNTDLVNDGIMEFFQSVQVNQNFQNSGSGIVHATGSAVDGNVVLTFAKGTTNQGVIELTSIGVSRSATLLVNSGSLVNAAGAVVHSIAGAGGVRILSAELLNSGTLQVDQDLTINHGGSHSVNFGTIQLGAGDLTISQSGVTPGFTNQGTVLLGGRMLSIQGGTATLTTPLTGPGGFSVAGVVLNLGTDLVNSDIAVDILNSTVNGPGKLINPAGSLLQLSGGTYNADVVNRGMLESLAGASINGALVNGADATLRIKGTAATGNAILTLASGFTNEGLVELTDADVPRTAALNITTGTLATAAGGTVRALAGTGGIRILGVTLENHGLLDLQTDLKLQHAGADHVNSGTIQLNGGDLDVEQSGSSPSLANQGEIQLAGHQLNFNTGALDLQSPLTGPGILSMNSATLNLGVDLQNLDIDLAFVNVTVNGPGKLLLVAGKSCTLTGGVVGAELDNAGDLTLAGTVSISGLLKNLPGATLTVHGSPATGNAVVTVSNGFTNEGTIVLVDQDQPRSVTLNVGAGALVNAPGATLRSGVGAGGPRNLGAALDNRGSLVVGQDIILSKSGADHLNSGSVVLAGGGLTVHLLGATGTFTSSGIMDLGSGGSMLFDNGALENTASGTFKGTGTLQLQAAKLTNNGKFAPGASPGIITVNGDYPQSATGELDIELGGLVPGTGHDQLVVTNKATLAGTLNVTLVDGYQPAIQNSYKIATFKSRSGTFSTVNFPLPGRIAFSLDYTDTNATVTVLNTAPTLGAFGDVAVSEQTPLAVDAHAVDDDPGQTLTYSLVEAPPSAQINAATGQVTWTPSEADGPGTFNFKVQVADNGTPSLSDTRSFVVTVREVNLPPVLTVPADLPVKELTQLSVQASATDPDLPKNTLTYEITSGPPGLQIDSVTGQITWIPTELQGPGSYPVTVKVTDSGSADAVNPSLSDTKSFTVTVLEVNLPPTFIKGADVVINEDAGAQSIPHWATGISAGPPGDAGVALVFAADNDNHALFTAQPSVAADGTLSYTPAANANGTATVTVTLKDDGGTANGGSDTSAPQVFKITINAVNDAPSFVKGADLAVKEDAGPQVVNGWATAISPGPANESTQALTFQVDAGSPALFSAAPAISATGVLTYTPAANANGLATVTVRLKDDGGTADGGSDTSAPQTFKITINAVNDAPGFVKGADQSVLEDAGPQTVNGWATAITAGPADESGQTVTFDVSSDNTALFAAAPAVDASGKLTYTPAPDANGSATVTVKAKDNGGTDNGGNDASTPQTFTITVQPVNDPPGFIKGDDQSVGKGAGAQTIPGWATSIKAGPPNEAAQGLTFLLDNDNTALFSAQPAVSATGTLTFTPAAGATGSASVTVRLQDDGGTANGGIDVSATRTFLITVKAPGDLVKLVAVLAANGSLDISWNSVVGIRYQLQFQNELGTDSWTDFGAVITASSTTTTAVGIDTGAPDARFYRVMQLP